MKHLADFPRPETVDDDFGPTGDHNEDEMIVISHVWDEIRRLMWNYVGIVRSNRRLHRAQERLNTILHEVANYYGNLKLHPDIIELRNIALVADLTVKSAISRQESRGIHYNIDFPDLSAQPPRDSILPSREFDH